MGGLVLPTLVSLTVLLVLVLPGVPWLLWLPGNLNTPESSESLLDVCLVTLPGTAKDSLDLFEVPKPSCLPSSRNLVSA